ncbi:9399_t:CDS:1, partial [Funneliformis geosporum]
LNMNRLNKTETNQAFLQKLRTKIKNQEISEKEVISLLGKKTSSKQTNKCRYCGRKLALSEKADQPTTLAKELAKLPKQEQKRIAELEKITQAFNKARIKH